MNTNTKAAPVIAYIRAAAHAEEEHAQVEAITAWHAARPDQSRPLEWITEPEPVDRSIPPARRPGLRQALTRLDDPADAAETLVTAHADQDPRTLLTLTDRARAAGWRLVLPALTVDTATPAGDLLITVMAAITAYQHQVISHQTRQALQALKDQGVTLGRPRNLDQATADRITRLRQEGRTLQEIADLLNAEGVPTASGAGRWQPTTIRRVALRAAPPEADQ